MENLNRMLLLFRLTTILVALTMLPAVHGQDNPFDATVAPILAEHCLDCHSSPDPKGGLDLTTAKNATAGGETGPAIDPNHLEASLLWQRIADDEMPPEDPLSDADK
jgi:hypothetical protein